MTITFTVNGETLEAEAGITLVELIAQLGLHPESLAALVNDEIVERGSFAEKILNASDTVELVRFVSGG